MCRDQMHAAVVNRDLIFVARSISFESRYAGRSQADLQFAVSLQFNFPRSSRARVSLIFRARRAREEILITSILIRFRALIVQNK